MKSNHTSQCVTYVCVVSCPQLKHREGIFIPEAEFIETWTGPKQAVHRQVHLYKFGLRIDMSIQ